MIGQLPEALEVCGSLIPINADFRNILTIFEALNDAELTDHEKAYVCLRRLYLKEIPVSAIEEAIKKAYWFCDGGDMPKSKPERIKTMDWKQDEQLIMPAVSRTLGVTDVRSLPYLHWWTFLGSFGEIGEGLFASVLNIRRKQANGKKLEKWEKEFYAKNKSVIRILSDEEKADIRETEEFLKTLI